MGLTRRMFSAAGVACLGLTVAVQAVGAAEPAEIPSLIKLSETINKAKTPSDVIAAYASASAIAGDTDITLEQAFVVRMVALGSPELAEAQAQDLSGRSASGLPWAVLANNSARKNEIEPAIEQISKAVKASPSNEFVARTAGQIIAWYDAQPSETKIPDATRETAESVRKVMSSRKPFAQAFDEVQKALAPEPENQGMQVVVEGNIGDLAAFSGNGGYGPYASTPMSAFYAAPYLAFPNYTYGYQPWGPRFYASGAFARLGGRVPFPTPIVGRDVRYIRTPTPSNGYVLLGDDGAISYFPAYYPQPIYADYYYGGPAFYSGPIYSSGLGFYGPRFGGGGFYGGGFAGGRSFGRPGGGFGNSRLMNVGPGIRFNSAAGQTPFQPISTPFQPVTTPFQQAQPFNGGVRPGLQRFR